MSTRLSRNKTTVKVTSMGICFSSILILILGILANLLWLGNHMEPTSHDASISKMMGQLQNASLSSAQLRSISRERSDAKLETNNEAQKQATVSETITKDTPRMMDTMSPGSQPRSDFDLVENVRLLALEEKVGQQLQLKNLQSCRWHRRKNNGIVIAENMCTAADRLCAFNPASYQRTWCDMTLPPKTAVLSAQSLCFEPPRIFPQTPTRSGTGMQPIHIIPAQGHRGRGNPFECDVPCEISGGRSLVTYRSIQGTNWKFTYSMEGSHYYPELNFSKDAYLNDTYFATTSFQTEIPLPYFSWAEYNITNPAVEYDHVIAGASFIARNCGSLNHREAVVETLMKYIRVDSLSSCLHNAEPPNNLTMDNKKMVQREYLFHLAFENSCEDDYITEKLWGTFAAGTLPIYFGAPNVHDHVPPQSIISVSDFETTEALGLYLKQVAGNKTLYESYHAWRTKPLPEEFRRKFNFTHTHSICRTCRWAYAKKYGLGWDHATQRVEELPRQLGRDDNGVITTPFQESWLSDTGQALDVSSPSSNVHFLQSLDRQQQEQPLQYNHERKEDRNTINIEGWERTAWDHDGVIDLGIKTPPSGLVVFRMETAIIGSPVQFNHRTVLQDDRLRMTVLTSWNASVSSPQNGTMDFMLESYGLLRMRVIVESVDTLHNGGRIESYTYYFGSFMAEDFFQPIELFRIADTITDA